MKDGNILMSYDLYGEMNKERGEYTEFGNLHLSFQYLERKAHKELNGAESKYLDIGTNMGSLPHMVALEYPSCDVTGVDMRAEAIKKGKMLYPEFSSHLIQVGERLDNMHDNYFDVVTMFDVIEHIPQVKEYIQQEVFRVLKPGGIFVFQTPNRRINPFYEILRSKSLTAYKAYHCSLQTPGSLKTMLLEAGFVNVVVEKNSLDSEFNRKKLQKFFGPLSVLIMKTFSVCPLAVYPNLWGGCRKPVDK